MKHILYFFLISIQSLLSQDANSINLKVHYGNQDLNLNQAYLLSGSTDSIYFSKLKFYLTGLRCSNENIIVNDESKDYFLYDFETNSTISFHILNSTICDKISFDLGVDSLTNMAGAQGGALDPIQGMYWAWQSGYINFKLEGYSPAIDTRKNKFQLHLGGFLSPYNTQRSIQLESENTNGANTIILDLQRFIDAIEIETNHTIMSPSEKAMIMSDTLAECFFIEHE